MSEKPTPRLDDELQLLTIDEVAATLRCSRRTVYVLMDERSLPYSSCPDRRVSVADLRAFVRSKKSRPR